MPKSNALIRFRVAVKPELKDRIDKMAEYYGTSYNYVASMAIGMGIAQLENQSKQGDYQKEAYKEMAKEAIRIAEEQKKEL
jgi:hypothetical protein